MVGDWWCVGFLDPGKCGSISPKFIQIRINKHLGISGLFFSRDSINYCFGKCKTANCAKFICEFRAIETISEADLASSSTQGQEFLVIGKNNKETTEYVF